MAAPSGPPRIPSIEVERPQPIARARSSQSRSPADPVVRNAIRYTMSPREYELLHKYVLSRSRLLRRRAPSVDKYPDTSVDRSRAKGKARGPDYTAGGAPARGDTYNARAIRHALRVFVASGVGMKAFEVIKARLQGRQELAHKGKKEPFWKSPNLRLSLSLSTILLLYRLLFRFLNRLRVHLLDPSAEPFRVRNPRTSQALTSAYAPAVGASLAGLALGICPTQKLRVSVAIYTIFRALEFAWNLLEDEGAIWGWKQRAGGGAKGGGLVKRERPWWWGSWMLQPFAFGQLLHAAVFDRECTPVAYVDFIWKATSTYLHSPPRDLPAGVKWPGPWDVADSLAEMAKLNWPPYVSPTLFPNQQTLPASLTQLAPLTSQAHPLITSLSCATLHGSDPSCLRTYLTFWVRSFPRIGRVLLLLYTAMLLPKYKALYHAPITVLTRLLSQSLTLSTFVTGAISTAWASICVFQAWFPRHVLPTQRFFLGGFLAGLWGFVQRGRPGSRGVFLHSAKTSVDSLWKVGVKRRWWRALRGGDLWVFVAALAVTGAVYERDARAIREAGWRKGVSWVRGTDWRDWALEEDSDDDEAAAGERGHVDGYGGERKHL